MKVLLANDTGIAGHLGCRGVSDAHARLLGRAGHQVIHRLFRGSLQRHDAAGDEDVIRSLAGDEPVMAMVRDVDAVVVNGEGTIHHGAGRPWLGLLAVAQRMGRATLLVNAVFQETAGFDTTLVRLDDFTVRESLSAAHARDRGLRPRVVPDSYLAARFGPAERPVSGLAVTDWHGQRTDVAAIVEAFQREHACTFVPLRTPLAEARWAGFPAELQNARLVVTARHHGVYAALVAGRPFVALPSNSHKVEGTLADLGLPHLLVTDRSSLERQCGWAVDHAEVFRGLVDRLTGGVPLTTFAALGHGGPSREDEEVGRLADDLRRAAATVP